MTHLWSGLRNVLQLTAARLRSLPHERRWALLAAVVIVVGVVTLLSGGSPSVSQPISFSHRKHTADLGLDCEFCHQYVRTGAHAGLPDAATCAMCHSVPQGTSKEAERLTEMLAAGEPLQFNKLFRLADHVYYTHRRHVGIAGLDCTNCHDGIAETDKPPKRPLIRITMKFCLECHREQEQTLDCVRCHR